MNIRIHRGTHQIGGCVTEYEYNGWHLFVDYGEELSGGPHSGLLKIEHLTYGDLSKSALLITHYHGDHIGCITKLPDELKIYIGKVGREIQLVLSDHLKSVDGVHQEMIGRLDNAETFSQGGKFAIGPFSIMPVTIDHSAFDAYAFRIEAGGVSVFHTGDFRTHGFRSGKFQKMMEKYVGHVDYVVCEATNVMRPDATNLSEHDLQSQFEDLFRQHKGNIVYLSSTNIDRLFSLYHAALKAGRPFYVDAYQKRIMDVVVKGDSMWTKSQLYRYGKYEPIELLRDRNGFTMSDNFKDFLTEKGYVLIARVNDKFNDLIELLPNDRQKYLSMWKGYLDERNEGAYNEKLDEALADGYEYMHTSGHCDMASLRDFFRMLQPKAIIPIHTDNPEAFANLFSDEWPVTVLNDGESISPISNGVADA